MHCFPPKAWICLSQCQLPTMVLAHLISPNTISALLSMLPGPHPLLRASQSLFAKNSTPVVKEQGRRRRAWGYYPIMHPGLLRLAPAGSASRCRRYCWNDFLACMVTSSQPRSPAQAGSRHSQKQTQTEAVTSCPSSSRCSSPLWKTKAILHITSSCGQH